VGILLDSRSRVYQPFFEQLNCSINTGPLHLHTAQDDDIMQTTTTMTAQRDLHQTICLLDWDDTLCCSSWLLHQNQSLDSPPLYDLSRPLQPGDDRTLIEAREMALQLKALEDVLITLLKQAMAQATRVVIVTNAEPHVGYLASVYFCHDW